MTVLPKGMITCPLHLLVSALLVVFLCLGWASLEVQGSCSKGIVITGIVDGKSNEPKGVELYVLKTGDYNGWKIMSNANGGDSWRPVYTFSGTKTAGASYLTKTLAGVHTRLTRSALPCFTRSAPYVGYYFFTMHASIVGTGGWDWGVTKTNYNIISDNSFSANGNDAYGVFNSTNELLDIYGQFKQDGTGEPWEYLNSWGYRKDSTLASKIWTSADWDVAAVNSLENDSDQQTTLSNAFGRYTPQCTTGGSPSSSPTPSPTASPSDPLDGDSSGIFAGIFIFLIVTIVALVGALALMEYDSSKR